jgi:stage II sporulation protein D
VEQPLLLPEAPWTVAAPGAAPRHYRGRLSVRGAEDELQLFLEMPLERYVAEVVAGESVPGTPEEALRALAVVVRSFVLAQGPRHTDADVCDLAHCQVLRGTGVVSEHRVRARAAAESTRGQVLVLASGAVAETPFHAACGGHTADPRQVLGSAGTGAASVADPGCPARAWATAVPLVAFRAALGPLLEGTGLEGGALDPAQLDLVSGAGGYTVQVVERGTGRRARGDAVARALDRTLGWGRVRSGRFVFRAEGAVVRVEGSGLGHGLGLCQAGAARLAAEGESYRAILAHYFPRAALR